MNNHTESQLSPLKQAYLALEKMQAKLEASEQAKREPIAIVGIGCRFPGGVNHPDAFWQLLCDGVDAISEVPASRWDIDAYYDPDPDALGKMSSRWGGFLEDVDQFDAAFFGIAPREAVSMDPQQRLLLEVAWEALEHAGQAPDKLMGSRTGVYIGVVNNDYRQLQLAAKGLEHIDTYYSSGVAQSVISGRLSYVLGLQGPSLSIDTACSSSLLAVHLACQSLRAGECRMALAGGINLMLIPEITVALSKYHMMAPDGRCKAFDARADGFVRGEGCGLIVIKRLSDAVADGDNILALIRGTAANQDGASSGLTAPNGPSQEAVIRDALANANVRPGEVTFIESHGTGTALGDPIEAQALGSIFKPGRSPEQPVLVGSVKTNLGHLEAASGIAGLIKTVLCLQHGQIPANLHWQEPNPLIPWAELPLDIPTTLRSWPADAPLVAGTSSFGFSGTNVHVVLAASPAAAIPESEPQAERPLQLLSLSAKNEAALLELAERFETALAAAPDASLADVSFSANTGRAHLNQRLALVAGSVEEARQKLATFRAGQSSANLISGAVQNSERPAIAFLFTGQGAQYVHMGRQLYETQPAFRQTLDDCAAILQPHLGTSLLNILYPTSDNADELAKINETRFTQPALFALEYALAALWRSWGIEPTVVMGHSIGEYVAACVAGVFSLEDGLKLIAERGRLMQALPAGGEMAAVFAPVAQVIEVVQPYASQVSIAAVNGPENVVISGEGNAVQRIVANLADKGIKSRPLTVSHAFHSPLLEPMLAEFEQVATGVTFARPRLKLVSNVSGELAMGDVVNQASYWRRHAREAVQFETAMQTLQGQGVELFVEVGPNPTLLGMAQRCLPDSPAKWLPSLRSGRDDWQQMLQSLGALYVYGVDVNWSGFEQAYAARQRRLPLPTYPFQRKRYWVQADPRRQTHALTTATTGHPLLGRRLRSALKESQFEAQLMADSVPFLDDHRVHGLVIMPATGYFEMILAAVTETFGPGNYALESLIIQEPFIIGPDEVRTVQTIVAQEAGQQVLVQIFSQGSDETAWQLHASCNVPLEAANDPAATLSPGDLLTKIRDRCPDVVTAELHYQKLSEQGLHFGPSLQGVQQTWRSPQSGEALGQIQLPEALTAGAGVYHLHPALIDACLQVLASAIPQSTEQTELYMPVSVDKLYIHQQPEHQLWSHVQLQLNGVDGSGKFQSSETFTANVRLVTDSETVIAEVVNLRLKRASRSALQRATQPAIEDWLYQIEWQPGANLSLLSGNEAAVDLTELFNPADIAYQLQPAFAQLNQRPDLLDYYALAPKIDAVSADYVMLALQELGWLPQAEQLIHLDTLTTSLNIQQKYQRLLARMLEMLQEDGVLQPNGNGWQVCRVPQMVDRQALQARWTALLAEYPSFEAELTFIGRCGPHLAAVLGGTSDPLALLFPGGSAETAEKLYHHSPFARAYNGLVQQAVAAIVARWPADTPLRILEIGAGTGGTSGFVLPQLPADRTEYVYTDISPLFLAKAAEKFSDYPFIRYQPLDIEQPLSQQGFDSHQFDIILAANVIHATADIGQALGQIKRLSRVQGLVVLLEMTKPERWVDLTFGLTDGWWKFVDTDLRFTSPLVPQASWQQAFAAAGFASSAAIPGTLSSDLPEQAVLLAQGPQLDAAEAGLEAEKWLILADSAGVGEQLAEQLSLANHRCVLVWPGEAFEQLGDDCFTIDPIQPKAFEQLLAESGFGWQGIVHLWSLDIPAVAELDTAALQAAQELVCGSSLHLLQSLAQIKGEMSPRLWLVTRNAQPIGNNTGQLAAAQAPLWGLGKVIALEHPDLRCSCVDLDLAAGADNAQWLAKEILADNVENQVAFRNQQRYLARLSRYVPEQSPASQAVSAAEPAAVQLGTTAKGTLDNLIWQPAARRLPESDEVEIRVHATGLNFKDVLNALDMYPGDAGPLGGECAGEVVAIGSAVEGLQIGQAVVALAAGSFSTFVTTPAHLVVPKPANLSFEEAATVPIPFLTAYYTLIHLGQLSAADKVLIHAAAGGVGMAAVHLAHQAGAEVFGTAGSPEKRAFLKELGVAHVMDSRSLDFADEIMALTGNQGVDVVLNSLADDFVSKSMSVVSKNGRFLEIGKRGVFSENQAAEVRPDVAYWLVDWTEACHNEPELIRNMMIEVMAAMENGSLKPLPHREFPTTDVVGAFRYMAQARHIGKIVVTSAKSTNGGGSIQANGSYLISGGLGGLGLLVADWLVDQGARSLVLLGRREPSEAAQQTIDRLEKAGAQVMVAQADVANLEQLTGVFAKIKADNMPPLRGVIHSAGVLDDGVLLHQSWSRFATVMAPKVEGAWHLHQLTQQSPLDFFVMFSSVASLLGSSGQGNHAAANTFLDILANYRRAQGLPALSINWGAWTEVGAAVKHDVFERIKQQGIGTIAPEQGLQLLAQLLQDSPAQVGITPVNWSIFLRQFSGGAVPPFLAEMGTEAEQTVKVVTAQAPVQPDFLEQLAKAAPNKRATVLLTYVQEQVCKVLGLDAAEQVGERTPLNELGLDSLMAVELRNMLAADLKLERPLPATLVYDYPTVEAITDYLTKEIALPEPARAELDGGHQADEMPKQTLDTTTPDSDMFLSTIEDLSDEEVDRLFAQQIQHLENWPDDDQ